MSDKDRALADIAATTDGVFTLWQAVQVGMTDNEIEVRAASDWVRMYHGVFRHRAVPMSRRVQLRAAARAAEPFGVLSHRTAAEIYDLPVRKAAAIEVSCPRWRRSQTSGLVVHESTIVPPQDIQLIHDLPVVTPERAAFELASIYRSPDFIEQVLHAARRKRLITYRSTKATFDRLAKRGRPGVQVFREALERWVPSERPTESEMETRLLQLLRRHGYTDVTTQYEVFDAAGRFVARVDAALVKFRVLIEYNSIQEHSDEWAVARDESRRNRFVALGYFPLVARHHDLKRGGGQLLADIEACIRRAERKLA